MLMKNKLSKSGWSRLYVLFTVMALPFLQQCTQDKNLIVEPERPSTGSEIGSTQPNAYITSIKLQASATYITANGKDTIVLSAMAYDKQGLRIDTNGFELFHNNRKITEQDFATTEAGEHEFVARLGSIASDTLTVEAREESSAIHTIGRIEIAASTQAIIADGRSTVTFEVLCYDETGQAVPSPSSLIFYANGQALQASELTTTRLEDQRIVAKAGEVESNEIVILVREKKKYEMVTIPVVFHIGHFGEAVGSGANLSADIIQGLLDDMNRGYANGFGSTNPNAVDMQIRFRLAQTDESGKALPEKGIVRTNVSGYDNGKGNNTPANRELGLNEWREWQASTILNPKSYYNIWIYPAEEQWSGLANYPSMSADKPLAGITTFNPGQRTHYINTDFNFPSPRINSKHRTGMNVTVIHEIGHTLGLRHTFSDNGCSTSDYCDDTYSYNYPYTDQPCPDNKGSLTPNENFMDYRGSRTTFTYEQRERVRHTIKHALWFPELVKSAK